MSFGTVRRNALHGVVDYRARVGNLPPQIPQSFVEQGLLKQDDFKGGAVFHPDSSMGVAIHRDPQHIFHDAKDQPSGGPGTFYLLPTDQMRHELAPDFYKQAPQNAGKLALFVNRPHEDGSKPLVGNAAAKTVRIAPVEETNPEHPSQTLMPDHEQRAPRSGATVFVEKGSNINWFSVILIGAVVVGGGILWYMHKNKVPTQAKIVQLPRRIPDVPPPPYTP
jgi:hypothetical protein